MDIAMRDLAMAKQTLKKNVQASTLLEAVGCDIDEAARNISYFQTADVGTISIGGQSVSPGSSLQINLRDQGTLLYLDRTAVVFDLELPVALTEEFKDTQGFIKNSMALLQPLQIQLGSQTCGIGNGHKLAQFYLNRRDPKTKQRRDRGLFMIDERSAQFSGNIDQYLAGAMLIDAQSAFHRQTDTKVLKCVITLKDLMCGLIDVPNDVLYIGLGQTLLINAKFNSASDVFCPAQNLIPSYTVKNAYIMKVYTELSSEQEQRILKSQIPLPFNSVISQPRPWNQNVNVTFNLGKGERLKKLVFGVFPTNGHATAVANNTAARFFSSAGNYPQWWSPNNFFPMAPFSYIQLSMNGYQVALNQYQIQTLSYSGAFSEDLEKWQDPFHSVLQHCHVIDLTRFGINQDWYGSGQLSENVLQVEYQYVAGTKLPYFGIELPADLSGFTHHSFVITQRTGEIKHGIYVS